MDATALAAAALDDLPANRLLGLTVRSAVDGLGVVALEVRPEVTNIIGSLHSSGVVALVDAAALAALLSVMPEASVAARLQPLGSAARLDFLRPVRGTAVATCRVDPAVVAGLTEIADASVSATTEATVATAAEPQAAVGRFTWRLRLAAADLGRDA